MEQRVCPIYEKAQSHPNHPALITEARTWTYRELNCALHSLTRFLEESGTKPQQRIAFIATPHLSTILLFFALFRLGAIACPLSTRTPQEKIPEQLTLLKAAHMLEPHTLPIASTARSSSTPLLSLDKTATLLFTSGSSGTPKIACHSLSNHIYNALGALPSLHLEPVSRWLLSLPLFHVSGIAILFRCFLQGATVVLSDIPLDQALIKHSLTHLSLVPTQLYRLLAASRDKSSLQCVLLGGAPLPFALLQQAEHLPLFTTYGLTEMSSMVTVSTSNPQEHSGGLLPFREVKIEADGEIWVRGQTLFQGYWNADEQAPIRQEGWFPTKDLGRWTPEGNLMIIGRKDRLFISGGENIQPEEIEQALCAIDGIRQASVIPIADPEFGQRPVAFIDDETGSHTLETIRSALHGLLPSFKHPIQIFPYPKDAGLKPNLSLLRAQARGFPSKTEESG